MDEIIKNENTVAKKKNVSAITDPLKDIEFDTIGLLLGLFLMIGGISEQGVIDAVANLLAKAGGGNITPIGASANIAGIGILRKEGYTVKNSDFFKIGIPFTLAAIVPAYIYLWIFYGV